MIPKALAGKHKDTCPARKGKKPRANSDLLSEQERYSPIREAQQESQDEDGDTSQYTSVQESLSMSNSKGKKHQIQV